MAVLSHRQRVSASSARRASTPMVRPRIGAGPRRVAPKRRSATTSPLFWRSLALSVSVVILGGGTMLGVHLMGVGRGPAASLPDPAPLAERTAAVLSQTPVAAKAAIVAIADANSSGAKATTMEPSAAAARPQPAAIQPTAEDFARPAFLEPIDPRAAALRSEAASPASAVGADGVDPMEVASIGQPADAQAPLPEPKPDAMPPASADGRSARIAMDVTFRSAPRRGRNVIGQLAAGTKVTLLGCKSWCEVVADGKRGYVYRRAVDR